MDQLPENLFADTETLSTAAARKLIEKVQSEADPQAKQKLVKGNLRLVAKIAHRFKNNKYSLGDIFQVGIMGLLKAIKKFDLERGVEFSTYAVPVIIGEIKMHLRADNPVKVSRSLKQKAQTIKQEQQKLAQELNREPTVKELSARLDFSREKIVSALEAARQPASLDKKISDTEDLNLLDQLEAEEEQYDYRLKKLALAESLNNLDERAQKIINLRFLEEKSQQEVANELEISQAHISRLEKKIVASLREKLN